MPKKAQQQVITANRLTDGVVVFRAADGQWTTDFAKAAVYEGTPLETALAEAMAQEATEVVGPYAFPLSDAETRPDHLRERIRATGPTVRPDLARPLSETA